MPASVLRYLTDIARDPCVPALERDARLGHSRYEGVQLRRSLIDASFVRAHRVPLGGQSGQVLLLEVTVAGCERLRTAGVHVEGTADGDVVGRFHRERLATLARDRWAGASVEPVAGLAGITVHADLPDGGPRRLALLYDRDGDVSVTTVRALIAAHDRVYVWTGSDRSAKRVRRRLDRTLLDDLRRTVECEPLPSRAGEASRPLSRAHQLRPRRQYSALAAALIEAYTHLHDLDWLEASPAAAHPGVKRRANPLSVMPEAQALRELLVRAAERAAVLTRDIPPQRPLGLFLERYLAGDTVAEIARDLGVSREWCSRAYRPQAFTLAALQAERLLLAAPPVAT